jgi:hypothetical protein
VEAGVELLITLGVAIFVYELYVWLPKGTRWLEERAFRLLPPEEERTREEWAAMLLDFPNTLLRLAHALSLLHRARLINFAAVSKVADHFDLLLTDAIAAQRIHQAQVYDFQIINRSMERTIVRQLEWLAMRRRTDEAFRTKLGEATELCRLHTSKVDAVCNVADRVIKKNAKNTWRAQGIFAQKPSVRQGSQSRLLGRNGPRACCSA